MAIDQPYDSPAPAEPTVPGATKIPASTEAQYERTWADPKGFIGALRALQNDTLGGRMVGLAFLLFILGGINILMVRIQLARP